ALRLQPLFQLRPAVKVILDGLLVARGDQQHVADAASRGFLDDILDRRPIQHRQHLLRHRLRSRQHPSPKPSSRYNGFGNHVFRVSREDTKRRSSYLTSGNLPAGTDDALYAVLDEADVEIDEKSQTKVHQADISLCRQRMYRIQFFDRLYFDDDPSVHKQVEAVTFIKRDTIVPDRHRHFRLHDKSLFAKLIRETSHVNRLQQARAKLAVDLIRGIHNG